MLCCCIANNEKVVADCSLNIALPDYNLVHEQSLIVVGHQGKTQFLEACVSCGCDADFNCVVLHLLSI